MVCLFFKRELFLLAACFYVKYWLDYLESQKDQKIIILVVKIKTKMLPNPLFWTFAEL